MHLEKPVCHTGSLLSVEKTTEQPVAIPYIRQEKEILFQRDNARPNIAIIYNNCLKTAHVNLFLWPPMSSDLYPMYKGIRVLLIINIIIVVFCRIKFKF